MKPLPALLLVFAATAALAQGAYRWIGKDGKVHYSDEPPPPAEAQKVEKKRLQASTIDSGGKLSYAARQAASLFPVTLYVGADCGSGCQAARAYLAKRGIPFTEKPVATAEDIAAMRQATKSEVLPTLLVGTRAEKGFEETAWGSRLDEAGYPAAP